MKLLLSLALMAAPDPSDARWLTLGAGVSESVAVLGYAKRIVAVDTTTRWPESLSDRPRVGYLRTLSAEGLLALRPSRVLASEAAGPPAALAALESAGVPVIRIPDARTWPEGRTRILAVGRAVDGEAEARSLVEGINEDLARLRAALKDQPRPKVVFVFAHGRGPVVAGRGTTAAAMIELAGGTLALPRIEGYKPPSPELLAAAHPDVILTTPSVMARNGGKQGLLTQPAFAATPAAKNGRVISMDAAFLLGLGPRTGEAAWTLAQALHPKLDAKPPR